MADSEHPLLATLPPKSDYLTYLTIIEYNLKAEDLPLLNDILQDTDLTINIGWDLVMLLLPHLPASETCLLTIARLGNPREVLLKVTEALRCIDFGKAEDEDDELSGEAENSAARRDARQEDDGPRPEDQFSVLLAMLSILHRRIKTKYPSRFIATTLQGVLAAFSAAENGHEIMVGAVDRFVRDISRQGRPELPPRDSGSSVPRVSEKGVEADPEAYPDPPSQQENQIIKRLIQSFITHVTEAYMNAISSSAEVVGLGWSQRAFEDAFPSKIVPGRTRMREKFETEAYLSSREECITIMDKLAQDVGLGRETLLQGCMETQTAVSKSAGSEEDPPSSPDDISLSPAGSLYLVAALVLAVTLKDRPDEKGADITLFPNQLMMVKNVIGTEESGGLNTAGSEPLALIDAVLALGIVAVGNSSIGEPATDEQFTGYLQFITLISANTPEPSLRFHAHFLASTVLRAHPLDLVRLVFIRDTLEHCPIESLKASAVSWIKGETLEAVTPASGTEGLSSSDSVFATPVALENLGPFLFPDLTQELGSVNVQEKWEVFKANLSFYLASLNFYYLLLSGPHFHGPLDIASLHSNNDIGGSMLGPLREASAEFSQSLDGGELGEIEGNLGVEMAKGDLRVLNDVVARVERGVIQLNKAPT